MRMDADLSASDEQRGGRADSPGLRVRHLIAGAIALALAVAIVLAIRPGGSATGAAAVGHLQTSSRYGQVPKWDSIPEPPPVTVVTATLAHPVLKAMEGYPVAAKLPGGASVRYFVEGPQVPNWVTNRASSGDQRHEETAPSVFDVTFSNAAGTVPLSAGDFTVITYAGKVLHPRVTPADGGLLPAAVRPGQTLMLKLSTSLPEGDGEIRWAPVGRRILVAYFWTLEFD